MLRHYSGMLQELARACEPERFNDVLRSVVEWVESDAASDADPAEPAAVGEIVAGIFGRLRTGELILAGEFDAITLDWRLGGLFIVGYLLGEDFDSVATRPELVFVDAICLPPTKDWWIGSYVDVALLRIGRWLIANPTRAAALGFVELGTFLCDIDDAHDEPLEYGDVVWPKGDQMRQVIHLIAAAAFDQVWHNLTPWGDGPIPDETDASSRLCVWARCMEVLASGGSSSP